MIVEGIVPPNVRTEEGPHGESTGFYGENKEAFVVNITAITYRRNPVSYGLICQRVEDYPLADEAVGDGFLRWVMRVTRITNASLFSP